MHGVLLRLCLAFWVGLASSTLAEGTGTIPDPAPGSWTLSHLDGRPFTAHATVSLSTSGEIRGRAPCNSFAAKTSAPLPKLDIGPIRSTRATCPDQSAETLFLRSLARMTHAQVVDKALVLTGDDLEMRFHPAP